MEDSSPSLSSCSTHSSEPLVGGSADLEAGFSASANNNAISSFSSASADINPYALSSSPRRVGSTPARNRRWPRRRFFNEYSEYDVGPHHFLDSCFLCKKPLSGNRDIFMYRGDVPFCSEECRQQQIEMDEARENANSVALRALSRRELHKEEPQSAPKNQKTRADSIQLAG